MSGANLVTACAVGKQQWRVDWEYQTGGLFGLTKHSVGQVCCQAKKGEYCIKRGSGR